MFGEYSRFSSMSDSTVKLFEFEIKFIFCFLKKCVPNMIVLNITNIINWNVHLIYTKQNCTPFPFVENRKTDS